MVVRRLLPEEVQFARRINRQLATDQSQDFSLDSALQGYLDSGTWEHLSLEEAQATFSRLVQALEIWQKSKYKDAEDLDTHYNALHSLYQRLCQTEQDP